jgi:3',5'-cyclic AMP phosphodiesterase CpdA
MASNGVVRIAAVSDIHYGKSSHGMLQSLFAEVTEVADVLVLAGDLTDYGLPEEAKALAKDLTSSLKIPAVGVLGNHDFEAGQEKDITTILSDAGRTRSTASDSPGSADSAAGSAEARSEHGGKGSSRRSCMRRSPRRSSSSPRWLA